MFPKCVYVCISVCHRFFPICSHGSPILAHSSFITCLWSPASYWPRKPRADGFPLFLSPRLWPVPPGSCSQDAPSRPPKKRFQHEKHKFQKKITNKNLSSFTISFIIGKMLLLFFKVSNPKKNKNLHRSLLWPLWPSHPSAMRDEHHAHLVGYRETPRPARQCEVHLWGAPMIRCCCEVSPLLVGVFFKCFGIWNQRWDSFWSRNSYINGMDHVFTMIPSLKGSTSIDQFRQLQLTFVSSIIFCVSSSVALQKGCHR